MAIDSNSATMFDSLKKPLDMTDSTKYKLMRGVADFTHLSQWNMYETGYSFLKVVKLPEVLDKLGDTYKDTYGVLRDNYKKILEFEYRQFNGLPNIESETFDITNNISTLSLIGKTTMDSNITFSMPYYERSGTPLTRFTELWLRCIKDPKTTFKHYFGMIENGQFADPGFEHETATFLVGFTDNTGLKLERSCLISGVQPTSAPLSEVFEYTKGTIENKELSLEFRGFLTTGRAIDAIAKRVLDDLNDKNSSNYIYKDETQFLYREAQVTNERI